jgi:alkylhydroperoxidase/carboxymuconolactone decarboxylase family protein YurZ
MYLPKKYTQFSSRYPEIFEKYRDLGIACRESGPLDEKSQNLIKIGIAMGTNSRGGVMSATRKALDSGATKDEITHAVLMGLTTLGFPAMISSMSWVSEVLENV